MARIRFIHPGLLTDEAYMAMSMTAKAAWPPIWTQCDDRGVFAWRPKTLKAEIFPDDDVDFETVLEEWLRLGSVLRVEIDGKICGLVKNFCIYQTPKFPSYRHALTEEMARFVGWDREKLNGKKIRIPEDEAAKTTPALPSDCNDPTPGLTQDSTTPSPALPSYVYDNDYVEVEDNPPFSPPTCSTGTPAAPGREGSSISGDGGDGFERFWATYPPDARTAPDYARRAYAVALRLGATPDGILGALRREMDSTVRRVVLAPAAWLRGGSWRVEAHAASDPPRGGVVTAIDHRFDGWQIGDHMELRKWRSARENGWCTRSAVHNAKPEGDRRQAIWDFITEYQPRVARFLTEHEPDGVPDAEVPTLVRSEAAG